MNDGVDFAKLVDDTTNNVYMTVRTALDADIPPMVRRVNINKVVRDAGLILHNKIYEDASRALDNAILADDRRDEIISRAEFMTTHIMRNYALGRNEAKAQVQSYLRRLAGEAEEEAFKNAKSMQKHPTLTRITRQGKPDCDWCQTMAGVYPDPPREAFRRHKRCDCRLIVSGYRTRNGELTNYKKRGN